VEERAKLEKSECRRNTAVELGNNLAVVGSWVRHFLPSGGLNLHKARR